MILGASVANTIELHKQLDKNPYLLANICEVTTRLKPLHRWKLILFVCIAVKLWSFAQE